MILILPTFYNKFVVKMGIHAHKKTSIQHHCTASIGVVLLRHLQNNDIDIVKLADQAMYQAKATGRNKIYFLDSKP